jgi:hypothetical protein
MKPSLVIRSSAFWRVRSIVIINHLKTTEKRNERNNISERSIGTDES